MVYFTHGYVSTDMLRQLANPAISQRSYTQHVTAMARRPNSLLERPIAQKHDELSKSSFLVHRLTDKGLSYLVEGGRITHDYAVLYRKVFITKDKKPSEFWHDSAACHITASIELGCRKAGLRFIPWYQILSHPTCPQTTRDAPNPFAIFYEASHAMIPDALFGIAGTGTPVFHFLEFDNNTESQSALTHKHKGYSVIMYRKLHTKHLGFSTFVVDYVTNAIGRLPNIEKGLRNLPAQSNIPIHFDRFRFKAVQQLNRNFGDRVKATDHMFSDWRDGNAAAVPTLQ